MNDPSKSPAAIEPSSGLSSLLSFIGDPAPPCECRIPVGTVPTASLGSAHRTRIATPKFGLPELSPWAGSCFPPTQRKDARLKHLAIGIQKYHLDPIKTSFFKAF
jgi:hypothetical protein